MLKKSILLTLVLVISLPVLASIVFGKKIARQSPEVLNYLSFNNGPFSWQYKFVDGRVEPLFIGTESKNIYELVIKSSGEYFFYSFDKRDIYFHIDKNTSEGLKKLLNIENGQINIRKKRYDTYVNYIINVEDGKITQIILAGSLLSGL